MVNDKPSLSNAVIDLSENFDDLLESLSTLQRLGELPAHELSEERLLKQSLEILHQSCKASQCTIYLRDATTSNISASVQLGKLLAIDETGTFHHRSPTRIEDLFIRNTIDNNAMQHCNDCSTLDGTQFLNEDESSIISVPLRISDQLCGVVTISHRGHEFFNPWGHRLMQLFSTFLGQQLAMCRFHSGKLFS